MVGSARTRARLAAVASPMGCRTRSRRDSRSLMSPSTTAMKSMSLRSASHESSAAEPTT
ncbi:hypothetical protein [Saccharopolyspora spinosa]|uniref:hypothetical protein n=1 Tax=Saccharopolyspora spinosa TaxID=60894 RepID=UPI001ED92B41|nr:hypothetical protein [Saccharopolyspora spinosa]